ncbi:MAG: hypothetical protein ACR2JC_12320 [Chloroflexota bacterium]|nr:MAG: hypothetical protein DLM70_14375 [Chloroflexota bacterium]
MRIIPTRVHGVLDFLSAATLVALPRLLGWDNRVTKLLAATAGSSLVYSLLTRYELGAVGALPMRAHLALDGLSGGVLCSAALLWRDREEAGVIGALYGLGVFELAAAVMTETEPTFESLRQRTRR